MLSRALFSSRGMCSVVRRELVNGRTGVLTLNRPKALNSLNYDMILELQGALREWKSSLDALVIQSAVPKAFCAGGDIVAVTSPDLDLDRTQFFKDEYELDHSLATLPYPVISIINGIVMGGGVGLSVHGRYRVATETTLFSMPEVSIGLFPDVGASWFLPRLSGKLGWYLGMMGHRLKGSDVFHAGIATHMCSTESLPSLQKDLLSASSSDDLESILSSYHAQFPLKPFGISEEILKRIDELFSSASSALELMESLEASAASGDTFAKGALSALQRASPTSLAITFRLLREGAAAGSLGECLNMEYNMVTEIMKRKDFYEGVRALLIDKDLSPKWSPSNLSEVGDIGDFFKKDRELEL